MGRRRRWRRAHPAACASCRPRRARRRSRLPRRAGPGSSGSRWCCSPPGTTPSKGQTSPQFQEGNDVEHYEAILDGFGGNPTGTLTEFYFENSYGQFLVEVDVLAKPDGSPYVSTRSSLPGDEGRCYYGDIDPPDDPLDDLDPLDTVIGAGGGGALGMAIEALQPHDPRARPRLRQVRQRRRRLHRLHGDHPLGRRDGRHGRPVQHVVARHLCVHVHLDRGHAAAGLRPPRARHGLQARPPGARAGDHLRPALHDAGVRDQARASLTIGVAAHEMAHALGEPDYYGTDGSSSGIRRLGRHVGRLLRRHAVGLEPHLVQPGQPCVPGLGHAHARPRGRARLRARATVVAALGGLHGRHAQPEPRAGPDTMGRRRATPPTTTTRGPRTTCTAW